MKTFPTANDIYSTIDATWPAAAFIDVEGWRLREGKGGGSRVSAATAMGDPKSVSIPSAEQEMERLGQTPQFMVRIGEEEIDENLSNLGYVIKDPVNLYACDIDVIAAERPAPISNYTAWPPLACQKEIWQIGGIGPARLDVMDRATCAKTTLLGRIDDAPVGTAFVGVSGQFAMIHALEILPEFRRHGLATKLTIAAAFWAKENGASFMTLVTTKDNESANRLYTSLGMRIVGDYHYRIKQD